MHLSLLRVTTANICPVVLGDITFGPLWLTYS
jgi:hypothetical protein